MTPAREPGRGELTRGYWRCSGCQQEIAIVFAGEEQTAMQNNRCPSCGSSAWIATPRPPMPEAEPPRDDSGMVGPWLIIEKSSGRVIGDDDSREGAEALVAALAHSYPQNVYALASLAASPTGEGAPGAEGEAVVTDKMVERATRAIQARWSPDVRWGEGHPGLVQMYRDHAREVLSAALSRPTGEGAEREDDKVLADAWHAASYLRDLPDSKPGSGDHLAYHAVVALCTRFAALRPSRPAPRETPLHDAAMFALSVLVEMPDQPLVVDAVNRLCTVLDTTPDDVTARTTPAAPRETEPSEAMVEAAVQYERESYSAEARNKNDLDNPKVLAAARDWYRRVLSAALRASNGGAER